jgi:hypothetical protein
MEKAGWPTVVFAQGAKIVTALLTRTTFLNLNLELYVKTS